LQEGESLENALRRFKRKVQTEDIIKEVKRHSFYLKPGEKKRVKEALARKRARKKTRKEQDCSSRLSIEGHNPSCDPRAFIIKELIQHS
jgi:small subunit ribosomal protein S21